MPEEPLYFVLGTDGFVVGLSHTHHVIDDARQFVGRGGDRLGSSEFSPHPAIEVPEIGLTAMECLSGHAECRCGSVLDLPRFDRQHFPTANPVVRTEPEPRGKFGCAAKAREVRTDLRQQGLRGEDVYSWDSRQVHSENSMEMTSQMRIGRGARG